MSGQRSLAALTQVASYLGSGYLMQSLVLMTGQRLSLIRSILITLSVYSVGLVAGGMVGDGGDDLLRLLPVATGS